MASALRGNINLVTADPYPDGWVVGNQEANRRSGYPRLGEAGAVAPALAVVGGSPNVGEHLQTLRDWPGDIWAINATWRYLRDNGINASFFTIDASEIIAEWAEGAEHAILADSVCPAVFDVVGSVEMVELGDNMPWGCTAACCAPGFAAVRGHKHVTLFGCESSFTDSTHAYRDEESPHLVVKCGGDTYKAVPGMLMQAETLARLVRAAPDFIAVAGGGLLPAMVEHGEFEVTHLSRSLHEQLERA